MLKSTENITDKQLKSSIPIVMTVSIILHGHAILINMNEHLELKEYGIKRIYLTGCVTKGDRCFTGSMYLCPVILFSQMLVQDFCLK